MRPRADHNESFHYPVLCWPLGHGAVCGHVVGYPSLELIARNVPKLKSALRQELATHEYGPDIVKARLKIVRLDVPVTYFEQGRAFPMSMPTPLDIAAVYGQDEQGTLQCFLPLLDFSFYCFDPEQLELLTRHYTQDRLRRHSPEQIFRMMLPARPFLETVTVTAGARNKGGESLLMLSSEPSRLESIAECFPPQRGLQRKRLGMPEKAWERSEIVHRLISILKQRTSNVLVVGAPATGKTAVLLEAIRRLVNLRKGEISFWRTSAQRMVADARFLGEWQKNCEEIVSELQSQQGVLWVTDIINLLATGGQGPEDSVARYLQGFISRGKLRLVGEITPSQLDRMRMLLPGFAEHFRTVHLEELGRPEMLRIIEHLRDYASRNLSITIDREAGELAYDLLDRFTRQERFPGKFMRFFGDCFNRLDLADIKQIGQKDVVKTFVERTGIAARLIMDEQPLDPAALEEWFRGRIIGQNSAVSQVCDIVAVLKAGLNDPGRPIATMLFAGPTGVGKTETAKALARFVFGQGQTLDPMIRLDMSELQHPAQIRRIIGDHGGQPGALIRDIRARPFSVLLLDEIEKAHPVFFDLLLSVLDEGMLVDSYGRETDFRNAIIIMTSNLGASSRRSVGFKTSTQGDFAGAVRQFFRPEFFNRIDRLIEFQPLDIESIRTITRMELEALAEREGLSKSNIALEFSDEVITALAETGFDPELGARPLQRTIDRKVVAPLSEYLVTHPDLGNVILSIDLEGDTIHIAKN